MEDDPWIDKIFLEAYFSLTAFPIKSSGFLPETNLVNNSSIWSLERYGGIPIMPGFPFLTNVLKSLKLIVTTNLFSLTATLYICSSSTCADCFKSWTICLIFAFLTNFLKVKGYANAASRSSLNFLVFLSLVDLITLVTNLFIVGQFFVGKKIIFLIVPLS